MEKGVREKNACIGTILTLLKKMMIKKMKQNKIFFNPLQSDSESEFKDKNEKNDAQELQKDDQEQKCCC